MSFIEKYQDIRPTLYSNFLSKTDELRLDRANTSLEQFTYSVFDIVEPYSFDEYKEKIAQEKGIAKDSEAFEALEIHTDDFDAYRYSLYRKNKNYDIIEFVILACLSGYHKQSNVDIARLKEKAFGFEHCLDSIVGLICNVNTSESTDSAKAKTEVNLLSYLRPVSYDEYINQELYLQDIENITELLSKSSNTYGGKSADAVKDVIEQEMYDIIQSKLAVICKRYKYIMGGAFGIDNYKGVYTGQQVATCQGVDSNGRLKILEPDNELNFSYRNAIDTYLNYQLCTDIDSACNVRQFDKELIYRSVSSGVPIYFPYKVLEIISKCSFTKNKQILSYTKLSKADAGTLSDYVDTRLREAFTTDMLDFMYLCLTTFVSASSGVSLKVADVETLNANLKAVHTELIDALTTKTVSYYDKMCDELFEKLDYYVDCVTTAVVVDKLEIGTEKTSAGTTIKKILEFRFKICGNFKLKGFCNSMFINRLRELQRKNASDMPGVEEVTTEWLEGEFEGIDLQYVYNKEKVYARPVFAYKALKALQDASGSSDGAVLGWNNILLGKDLHDGLVASQLSKDNRGIPYHLQDHNAHFIISGSRSGKGVMCYNIFATAIASQIPMFYLDGKPDTATVLKGLCPDMFAFNSGAYDATMDYAGHFNPENYTFQIPQYARDLFIDKSTCFNYAWMRCAFLVLTMVFYADRCNGAFTPTLASAFKNGILLILDEFTAFNGDFLHKAFSAENIGWFNRAMSIEGIKKAIKSPNDEYMKLKSNIAMEEAKGDKANAIKIANWQKEMSVFQDTHSFALDGLYAAAVAEAYRDIQVKVADIQNRGKKLWEGLHVFVIGQSFDDILEDLRHESWYKEGGGTNARKFNSSQGINPFIHIINSMNPDVITGYQMDRPKYLAQSENGFKTVNLLNGNRRCFAYKETKELSVSELEKLTDTRATLKSDSAIRDYLSTWHYFKPFLILNNGITPLDEHPDVGDELIHPVDIPPKQLANMRKGAAPAPSGRMYIESQYVGQCLTQCENAGLTWEDLLEDNADETGRMSDAIGFDGYIRRLGSDEAIGNMALSGHIATQFVQQVIGYPGTWLEFVCDFRPEWIFKISDFDEATGVFKPIDARLSNSFFNKNLLVNNFVELFGSMTESLQPFYENIGGTVSPVEINLNPIEAEDPESEPDEDGKAPLPSPIDVDSDEPVSPTPADEPSIEDEFDKFYFDMEGYESEVDTTEEEEVYERLSDAELRAACVKLVRTIEGYLHKPINPSQFEACVTFAMMKLREVGY